MALTRRTRPWWIIGALVVLVVVGGVIVAVNVSSSDSPGQVAQLKATLDKLPLPAGTVLVDETAHEAEGDAPAGIDRQYKLPSATDSTAQLQRELTKADYRLVDPQTGDVDPGMWQSATSKSGGDIYVLPPGASGDGIELTWQGTRLDVALQPGQVR